MADHVEDIVSDFSAIHGIRDIRTMSSRVFVMLASRLAAYPGTVQVRARAAQRTRSPSSTPTSSAARPDAPAAIPLTPQALRAMNDRLRSVGQQPIGYAAVRAPEEDSGA